MVLVEQFVAGVGAAAMCGVSDAALPRARSRRRISRSRRSWCRLASTLFGLRLRATQRAVRPPDLLHHRLSRQRARASSWSVRSQGADRSGRAPKRRPRQKMDDGRRATFLPVRARRRRAVVVGVDGRLARPAGDAGRRRRVRLSVHARGPQGPRSPARADRRAPRRAGRRARARARAAVPDRQIDGRAASAATSRSRRPSPASSASGIRCSRARRARCATRC